MFQLVKSALSFTLRAFSGFFVLLVPLITPERKSGTFYRSSSPTVQTHSISKTRTMSPTDAGHLSHVKGDEISNNSKSNTSRIYPDKSVYRKTSDNPSGVNIEMTFRDQTTIETASNAQLSEGSGQTQTGPNTSITNKGHGNPDSDVLRHDESTKSFLERRLEARNLALKRLEGLNESDDDDTSRKHSVHNQTFLCSDRVSFSFSHHVSSEFFEENTFKKSVVTPGERVSHDINNSQVMNDLTLETSNNNRNASERKSRGFSWASFEGIWPL